ncbi:MAG: HD-GYP domain-containing protein [Gemmatimonadales bacterium]
MPSTSPYRVTAYVALFAVGALLLLTSAPWDIPTTEQTRFLNALVAFAVLGVASEAAFLRLSLGTSTSSVSYIPCLAAVVLMGPGWAMALAGFSMFVGEAVVRRKAALKVVFNVSNAVVAIGVSGLLFGRLGGTWSLDRFDNPSPFAFIVAVASYFVINSGSTAVAVALSSDVSIKSSLHRLVGTSLLFDVLSTPLALLLAYLYTTSELVGIVVVVLPLFLVRHVHSVNLRLEEANRELLELMVKAIEARDPYTSGHSLRVSRVASLLAGQMGLSVGETEDVETAALLHDVGKIHEEFAPILRKEGRLTEAELALMQTHSAKSYELVRTISKFRRGVDVAVLHHHENFDGTGYPEGLRGEDIPLAARIIMVADTTDAMTTDRPYRAAMGFDRVVAELRTMAGRQFDPSVVDAFIRSSAIRNFVEAAKSETSGPRADSRASSPGIAYVG